MLWGKLQRKWHLAADQIAYREEAPIVPRARGSARARKGGGGMRSFWRLMHYFYFWRALFRGPSYFLGYLFRRQVRLAIRPRRRRRHYYY